MQSRYYKLEGLILFWILLISTFVMGFENFITRQGDELFDGDSRFKFISFNTPALHYVEDYRFDDGLPLSTLPTDFEIEDTLITLNQLGGRVARTYILSVKKMEEGISLPCYVTGPGCFDEVAFRRLDKVIELANKHEIRLIIPFVDKHGYHGGITQYAEFRGKPQEAFWTDEQVKNDFKQLITFVLNRTNYYTGVKYKDEKAIMAWELGNELSNNGGYPGLWIEEMAKFVKEIDTNHLMVCPWAWGVREHQLINSGIDIVSSHFYPNIAPDFEDWISRIEKEIAATKGKKAYMIGEFGFVDVEKMKRVFDTVIQNGGTGALLWSIRGHARHGGFYWHSEYLKPYETYHWPGFDSGDERQERSVFALMREKAYEIQSKPVPPLAKPKPPVLLQTDSTESINWLGSAGASCYDIQRSASPYSGWKTIGEDVSDARNPYGDLFSDTEPSDSENYYRIIAKNSVGSSEPSNVICIKNKQFVED